MYYSLIGFLALLILLIANHDILLKRIDRSGPPVQRVYYCFLLCVIAYYVTDILWGILDALSLMNLLYADTVIYYLAMASGILLWTQYVFAYLEEETVSKKILHYVGVCFFCAVCLLMLINFFKPVMFIYDENGVYQARPIRHVVLLIQVLIFLLVSIYALLAMRKTEGDARSRHLTIGLFGLIMVASLSMQLFFPLLPLYSIGYMLGNCLLRTFVVEGEKEAYQKDLEAALQREKKQMQELFAAWELAYTDALTGAKSKLAYLERESRIDREIAKGTAERVAVVVFDLNGLKQINDTLGHDMGDKYIADASAMIKEAFQDSPLFRIGGDEFVVIPEGEDYQNREALLERFQRQVEENSKTGRVVVSAGMAEYIPGRDFSFERVFKRADHRMYRRKEELKNAGREST